MSAAPAHRRNAVALVLATVLVGLSAAAAIAIHQRTAVVHWLLARALASGDLASTRFTVEAVGLDRLVLGGVRPDLAGWEHHDGRIVVRYAPRQLLARHVEAIEIDGFGFVVTLPRANGDPAIALPAVPSTHPGGGGPGWTVGSVEIRDMRIAIDGPWTAAAVIDGHAGSRSDGAYEGALTLAGSLTPPDLSASAFAGSLAFTVSPQGPTTLSATLTAGPLNLPLFAAREGRFTAMLRDGTIALVGRLLTEDGSIDVEAEGRVPREFSLAALAGTLRITAERPPLPLLRARSARLEADLAEGAATATLEILAREGRVSIAAAGPLPATAAVTTLRGQATVDLDLADVALPGIAAPLAVKGRTAVTAGDVTVSLHLLTPLVVTLSGSQGPVAATIAPDDRPLLAGRPARITERAEFRVREARIATAARPFAIADVDATLALDPAPQIEIRRAVVRDLGPPPALAPVTVAGRVSLDDRDLRFAGRLSAARNRLVVDVDGSHRTGTDRGGARVRLHPLTFRPDGLQPGDLVAGLGDRIAAVDGRLHAEGRLDWGRRAPASAFTIRLDDVSFGIDALRLDGVGGRIVIDRLWPLRTPPGQSLTVRRIGVGAPMTDAVVTFRIDEQSRIVLDEARIDVLGGRSSVVPTVLDPAADAHRLDVRLIGIDLAALLAVADIDGAAASGRLTGDVPLVVTAAGFSVSGAVLTTEAPGLLRYVPATPPVALQAGGEGVSLMLAALRNFHYDEIAMRADGRSGEEWRVRLAINGNNPDFMDGHPFVFNLDLSGRLDEVIRAGLLGYRLPTRIGEGLSRGDRRPADRESRP